MSMGIYYKARRDRALSAEEENRIGEISEKYWAEYPRKDMYEGPGTFTADDEEGEVYSGVLRVPIEFIDDDLQGMNAMKEFLDYWLKWLTDVTRVILGAEWEVQFEDVPLIWEEEAGWRMMRDDEYGDLY